MAIRQPVPARSNRESARKPAFTRPLTSEICKRSPRPNHPKKKVNGFIGFRGKTSHLKIPRLTLYNLTLLQTAYYSSIFNDVPQSERSSDIRALWQADTFRNEWNFVCEVYSAIREFLEYDSIGLQQFIRYSIPHLGIVDRSVYLATFNWSFTTERRDGVRELHQTSPPDFESPAVSMDSITLVRTCMRNGLVLTKPHEVLQRLSQRKEEMILMKRFASSNQRKKVVTGSFHLDLKFFRHGNSGQSILDLDF